MKSSGPDVLLDQMPQAAHMACSFIEGMEKDDVVWETVLTFVPELVYRLPLIRAAAASGHGDPGFPR